MDSVFEIVVVFCGGEDCKMLVVLCYFNISGEDLNVSSVIIFIGGGYCYIY